MLTEKREFGEGKSGDSKECGTMKKENFEV